MKIVALFDFKGGKDVVMSQYRQEFEEITTIINAIDATKSLTKISKEKTMIGRTLYSPVSLNQQFKQHFKQCGWYSKKVVCDYTYGEYLPGYKLNERLNTRPYREMDFLKDGKKLGVEVQFGKYAFMVYNVCAKMTIFKNLGFIDAGIEIVPIRDFAAQMSTGVSYFEQFAWDLTQRGTADIDIPVFILGIDAD